MRPRTIVEEAVTINAADVHLTEEVRLRFEQKRLTAAEIESLFTHLERCASCAERFRIDARFGVAFERGDERHLDLETEMIPFVDGLLDAAGREIVESHVEECPLCRNELSDLHAIARTRPRRSYRLLALAASLAIAVSALLLISREERTPPPAGVFAPPRAATATMATPRPALVYETPAWTKAVEEALKLGRLPFPDALRALQSRAGTVRGSGEAAARGVFEPAGIVVESTRPRFRWPSIERAAYEVFVFADDEEITRSGSLDVADWYPRRDLPRGRTYQWQVEVRTGDGKRIVPAAPIPPPSFHIVASDEHRQLEQARSAHPDDSLLLAVLHARSGLVAEARAYASKLEQSPDPRVRRLAVAARQSPSPISTKGAQ